MGHFLSLFDERKDKGKVCSGCGQSMKKVCKMFDECVFICLILGYNTNRLILYLQRGINGYE